MAGKPKAKATATTEQPKSKYAYKNPKEMTSSEKSAMLQGMNFKERQIKDKLGMFVPKKQG